MIKKIHEIRLCDVILLDATKNANTLKKYWFVPLFLCRKELEKLGKQIFDLIGGSAISDLEDQFDKIMSYRKLQILEALYKAVTIELGIKPRINTWKILLEKKYKESDQLEKVLSEIKKYTGIEITLPEDLETFSKYVQSRIDKHAEMFPEKVSEGDPVSLQKIIYSVFNFMQEPYNEKMRLITFCEMKQMAEDKIKTTKTEYDGIE